MNGVPKYRDKLSQIMLTSSKKPGSKLIFQTKKTYESITTNIKFEILNLK